ncbi:MAG: hypothetical protein ABI818_06660 [Acidobacteriota bacterium]
MKSERDAIDRLLRQSLPGLGAELPADACLETDVFAAWSEGTLTPEERAVAESHAAACSRCQAILSSMARIEPERPRQVWWAQLSMVRWLVPLTAVAALALWIAVPRQTDPPVLATLAQRDIEEIQIPRQTEAPRPVEADASAEQRKTTARNEPRDSKTQPGRTSSAAGGMDRQKSESRRDDLKDARSLDSLASRGAVSPSESTGRAVQQAPPPASAPAAIGGVAGLPPAPAAAPPPATAAAPPPAAADKSAVSVSALNESVAVPVAGFAARAAGAAGLFDIMSPDPAVRWRFDRTGIVQRSTDGGTTWTAQQTGTTAPIAAGWSSSPMVCWLVGRAGTVLLSSDGASWRIRPFPAGVDLVSVRATDANLATVTATDGRRFSTADGGLTWSPAQE